MRSSLYRDAAQLSHGIANASASAPFLYQDIHAPRDLLPSLAAARQHDRELILLTTNWQQYDLAVNLVANLRQLGLDHYILLGDNEQLVQHAARRAAVAVVWSSMLERYVQPVSGGDSRCPLTCPTDPPAAYQAFGMNRASRLVRTSAGLSAERRREG